MIHDTINQQDSVEFQNFLDTNQYSSSGLKRYEQIFGKYYVSTGGEATTAKFCAEMNLLPGQKVLDIGSGMGGSAFFMAQHYGVDVFGVDLSTNMTALAKVPMSNYVHCMCTVVREKHAAVICTTS